MAKKSTVKIEINWADMDREISQGTAKLQTIAKFMQVNPSTLRAELIAHYGPRIMFVRGRTGGIRFTPTT